jgi:HK97 gp10 family phage protein
VTFKLNGVKSIQKQLNSIGEEMRPKLLQQSMRQAFKPVLDSAVAKVPTDSGELKSALALASAKGGKGGDRSVAVGIIVRAISTGMKQAALAAAMFNQGQSRRVSPARRWHFIELGTRYQRAQPFIRPAFDENAKVAFGNLADEVRKKIAKALRKK